MMALATKLQWLKLIKTYSYIDGYSFANNREDYRDY